MELENRVAATTGEWAEAHKPIVVAVDGSERNRSAVTWASGEAAAAGCKVVLVTAIEDHLVPTPHFSLRSHDRRARDMLAGVRDEVRRVAAGQDVDTDVVAGSPVEVLLDRSADARMVVVGKRGLGGFARMIVGSTSIALAGRANVPVAIVPDNWKQEEHQDSAVVLGIDPYRPEHTPIHLAFSRARQLGVPLVAVHGWETPTAGSWDDSILDAWRDRFPEIEVVAVHSHSHPAMAVLDAAEHAQLVILGRQPDGKLGAFPFGSVTRAVLHYSECPVMVVPTEAS